MKITPRDIPPRAAWTLEQAGVHPLLARLYAARGVQNADELDDGMAKLLPPSTLKGSREAAALLADSIAADARITIVADYDCDGATACTVAMRGLALLGARHVRFMVPDRVADGYGLTPPISERVHALGTDLLLTVDNGIASIDGVARAKALGMKVLVTDHHLPALIDGRIVLPEADVLVNPNQPGCEFASKNIAGVGVIFYVLLALRAELRTRGAFDQTNQPKLDPLLPLVALGTVADVVKLDSNNRRLVAQGLKRIRAGAMPPGVLQLFNVASRKSEAATTFDFGFALGPRINAAGRLADMTVGIECLLTDDMGRAEHLAKQLDAINRERRDLEGDMRNEALLAAEALFADGEEPPPAVAVYEPHFHEGVVGIVASRIKEKLHRPTFVFAASQAQGQEHIIKGSGRSIPGFHLRDALDLVCKRHPGLLLRFGGHAMAAGCTLLEDNFNTFQQAFTQAATELLDAASLQRRLETDGPLAPEYCRTDIVDTLHHEVWGQGFAPPTFSDEVEVLSQRLVGEKHLALKLRHHGQPIDGMWFGRTESLPPRVLMAFRMEADEWRGVRKVRFLVEGAEV